MMSTWLRNYDDGVSEWDRRLSKIKLIVYLSLILLMVSFWILVPAEASEVQFNTTIAGDRNMGQEYSWTVNNVSGLADVHYHYNVYDYRVIGKTYEYHSPAWGTWFNKSADPGKKYLAVWVRGWLEGTAWYGWDQDRFMVWAWDNWTIKPEPVHMQDVELRKHGSGRRLPAVIRELENRTATLERGLLTSERYGWKDENQMERMEPGRSNAFEGVILYQIPEAAQVEDLRVAGWFGYYGTVIWHLSNITIDQDSIEKKLKAEQAMLARERVMGMRLSDRLTRAKG